MEKQQKTRKYKSKNKVPLQNLLSTTQSRSEGIDQAAIPVGNAPSLLPTLLPDFSRGLPTHTKIPASSRTQEKVYPSNAVQYRYALAGAVIPYTQEHLDQLRALAHPKNVLVKSGYSLQTLTASDLEGKKRCYGCSKPMWKFLNKKPRVQASRSTGNNGEGSKVVTESYSSWQPGASKQTSAENSPPHPELRCKYHNGRLNNRIWTCCGKAPSSDPCSGSEQHVASRYRSGEIESLYQFHPTRSPGRDSDVRKAVAIDCEMGTARSQDCELIRVTLIDYFTSEILIDRLVYPDVEMQHYNTKYSGVSRTQMDKARRDGTCFRGRDQAREAVWKFVGPDTIVIGHSAQNDLNTMRWIHTAVVDTYLIEAAKIKVAREIEEVKAAEELAEAEANGIAPAETPKPVENKPKMPKGSGPTSLKTLSMKKLGRDIQSKFGHDSLEDALAARDLAHYEVVHYEAEGVPV